MKKIEVRSQKEFNALPEFFVEKTQVRIIDGNISKISKNIKNGIYIISESAKVNIICDSVNIELIRGSAKVNTIRNSVYDKTAGKTNEL